MSYQELFRACDCDSSGGVDLKELETVLLGFSAEFYNKDTTAIRNFFDLDGNGICSENEFMT